MALLIIIFFFFYIYTLIFLIIIAVHAIGRRRIYWPLVIGNLCCIGLFIFLQKLVEDHKLRFTGTYDDHPDDWGAGLSNVSVAVANEVILILVFTAIQIFFWSAYRGKLRRSS